MRRELAVIQKVSFDARNFAAGFAPASGSPELASCVSRLCFHYGFFFSANTVPDISSKLLREVCCALHVCRTIEMHFAAHGIARSFCRESRGALREMARSAQPSAIPSCPQDEAEPRCDDSQRVGHNDWRRRNDDFRTALEITAPLVIACLIFSFMDQATARREQSHRCRQETRFV